MPAPIAAPPRPEKTLASLDELARVLASAITIPDAAPAAAPAAAPISAHDPHVRGWRIFAHPPSALAAKVAPANATTDFNKPDCRLMNSSLPKCVLARC